MKRYLKIAALSAVAAALIAGIYFVSKSPDIADEEQGENIEEILVRNLNNPVISMKLSNGTGTYEFVKNNGEWQSVFRQNEKTHGNTVVSLESILCATFANELIEENVSSLSKYGLDEPSAKLSGVTDAGEEVYILIGSNVVGTKYYFTMDNKNVYTMGADEAGLLLVGMSAFVDLSLTSLSIENITKAVICAGEPITIEKKQVTESSQSADDLFSYAVTTPVRANASPTDVQSLFEKMSSVGASDFIYDMDSSEAHIDENRYFEVVTDSVSLKYFLGAEDKDFVYVKKEGAGGIYKVSKDMLSFIGLSVFDLVDKHISLHYISEVSSVLIKSNEGEYKIIFKDNPSVNGKNISEDKATSFYQSLISLSYDGSIDSSASGENEVTITFYLEDGSETIEFLDAGVMDYEVRKAGLSGLKIQKKYVRKILSLAKEL